MKKFPVLIEVEASTPSEASMMVERAFAGRLDADIGAVPLKVEVPMGKELFQFQAMRPEPGNPVHIVPATDWDNADRIGVYRASLSGGPHEWVEDWKPTPEHLSKLAALALMHE